MYLVEFFIESRWFTGLPRVKYEYDSNNFPIYIGVAPRGTPTSVSNWRIAKLTYDANFNVTDFQTSSLNVTWDNRASETYV